MVDQMTSAPPTGCDALTLSDAAAKGLAETLSLILPLLHDPKCRDIAQSTIYTIGDNAARLRIVTQLYEAVLAGDLAGAENIQRILAGNLWPNSLAPREPR